jgi:nuclear pore complex protein Nup133
MEEIGEGHHEDVMRAFFRFRINEIGNVVKKVVGITTQASAITGRDIIEFLPESNRIILVSVQSFESNDSPAHCKPDDHTIGS